MTVRTVHVNDDRSLTAEVAIQPVRMSDGSCAGEVGGWVEDEDRPDLVWAMVSGASPDVGADPSLLEPEKSQGACAEAVSTVELTAPAAVGGRDIMIQPEDRWVPTGGGDYGPCELPGCDPDTGDPPKTASCDDGAALVDDIRTLGDVGRHAWIGETRCQDSWAMVEVDIGAGACGVADGTASSCVGQRVDRLFLRAGSPHWDVLTRTSEAGCGNVTDVAAELPTRPVRGPYGTPEFCAVGHRIDAGPDPTNMSIPPTTYDAPMHAVILAGGRGVRLRPYTTAFPKPLVPIGDEYAIIEIVLRQLRDHGFTGVTIAIGHLGQLIRAYCGDGSQWGLSHRLLVRGRAARDDGADRVEPRRPARPLPGHER